MVSVFVDGHNVDDDAPQRCFEFSADSRGNGEKGEKQDLVPRKVRLDAVFTLGSNKERLAWLGRRLSRLCNGHGDEAR